MVELTPNLSCDVYFTSADARRHFTFAHAEKRRDRICLCGWHDLFDDGTRSLARISDDGGGADRRTTGGRFNDGCLDFVCGCRNHFVGGGVEVYLSGR